MKLAKKAAKFLLVSVLLTAVPIGASAEETKKAPIDYVALGDSLAAGMTPYGQDGPNDWGYPEYLKARMEKSQFPVTLNNFGSSGATSADLRNFLFTDSATQQKIKDSELVTLDIGANDVLPAAANPAQAETALYNVAVNLETILGTIKQLNPTTEVYVMGYYNPFPYLPSYQQVPLLQLLNTLNVIIKSSTARNGYTFVPTEKVIAKRYQEYLPNPNNIHLSLEGYQVVATQFWKAIDSE